MTSQADHSPPSDAPHDAELGFELAKPARWSPLRILVGAFITAGVFAALFSFAYLPRKAARETLAKEAAARVDAVPRVAVVTPRLVSSERKLSLPGSVQPLEEAVIYARASGYVRRWLVDIGTHVKEGQLLAEIDTPELDQELAQARAALAQAQANVVQAQANKGLATTRLDRTGRLVEAGLSPQQDLDQTQAQSVVGEADLRVAEANVAAQNANIRRIGDLRGFSRVMAPFAGTVTERSVERGSLVTAGNIATPLFKLASTDTVRVFVQVPQDAAPSVVLGAPAELHVREFPNEKFTGTVSRTAGALDSATRTLSTEVRVANPSGRLLAGMYAEVKLSLPSERRVFELPATVLMVDAAGLRIGIVSADDTVRLKRITLERDLGATVQVATGLTGTERVVQIAGMELEDGQKVEPVAGTPVSAASAPPPAPAPR
ncbi:MAG TPA: efflux RND transporter periplasmic adaptor subunit [Polyangiaceae bacterium]|nr:efflux RND transporter periplasmic adaptor subunit [Polyangiaceae bacterium]